MGPKNGNPRFLCRSFLILLLNFFVISSGHGSSGYENTPRRFVRSPQLFSGKNVLSDLTQGLKPITLNDLNDFRQKMANLANLTALLDQAVAAEKAARSSLQTFVNSIKEQITGITTAVNPDPENYWMESTLCGGILVSQTGKISYRHNEYYKDHERCIWTVRANYRSKIKIAFNTGGLEEDHDYVAVTELISKIPYGTEWVTKKILPGQTNIFEGPLIFITFVSDGSVRKTGFQLDFEGMGSNINLKTIYQHFHLSDWTGQFDAANLSESLRQNNVKLEDNSVLKVSIVINPSYWNISKLKVSIPESSLGLRPDNCGKTDLAILNDFAIYPHGTSSGCCASTCEISSFETSNNVMLGLMTSSDLSEASQFEINWATDISISQLESVDTCGGILKGDFGKISYKADTNYENNERCVWVLMAEKAEGADIKIQLVKDGFEHQYDYVTISHLTSLEDNNPSMQTDFLYKSDKPIKVPSAIVFVEFYSDPATFGKTTGFEMIWEIKYNTASPMAVTLGYTKEETGSKPMQCFPEENAYIVNVLNPQVLDGSSLVVVSDSKAGNPVMFKSERGSFSKIENSDSGSYYSPDGTMIAVMKCDSDNTGVTINWRPGKISEVHKDGDGVFTESDECGVVLEGDSGRISYKLGKEYNLNERCTWVIKAKRVSTITVQLMADGFESCCDGVHVNKVNIDDGTIDSDGIAISRENRFHTLEGPVLLVTFHSDHSVKGTGFTLEFQTKGERVTNDLQIKHSHVTLPKPLNSKNICGPVFLSPSENSLTIETFVLQPEEKEIASCMATVALTNMEITECDKDSIVLYEVPTISNLQIITQYPDKHTCAIEKLAGEVIPSQTAREDVKYQVKGALIAIVKVKDGNAEKRIEFTFG